MTNLFVELSTPITGPYQQPTGLFINNEFVPGVDGKTFEVINPSTEEVITSVHEATEKDVDIAVAAARKAFEGPWRKLPPSQRAVLLNKLADLAEAKSELLASVEALDNGKAYKMALGDVGAVIATLRYYAGWADKIEGRTIDVKSEMFHYSRREPVGYPLRSHIL
jgi:aldehyde dehydrogenase (NAD+)